MLTLDEAQHWVEARVDDVYGSPVGRVLDVYSDPVDHQVHWLLLGSDDDRVAAVPVHYSIPSEGHVWVPIAKDLIRSSPPVEPGQSLVRERELELCAHYGGLRKRAAQLGARGEGAVTAAPLTPVAAAVPRT